MKKIWVIVVNIFIMVALLTFVALYSSSENRNSKLMQIEHFENTTITMKHVTENYLEGEQRICDVWARYINSKDLTIEEAVSFIRISHVLPNASVHIVYADTLSGLSTKAKQNDSDDYSVSYGQMDLLNDLSWISEIGESINISRAYTNPINGEQSIAFCNIISLKDPDTDTHRKAVLLRILPVAELEEKWIFPKEEFKSAELSIIDNDGDYIIKGHSFKNSNLFEFYRSYNIIDSASAQDLFGKITSTTGSTMMLTIDKLRSFGANVDEGLQRCVNNESLYLRLVDKAIHDPSFDSLREIYETGDLKKGFETAHALKGVTANLALTPLFSLISEITELLRSRTETDYRPYIEEILAKRDELL
ncbi:MAG: Hpt domain-containing protein [Spirochaetales bacterium]|nr:Hpt domain-containing protein [Spirochaetales bacterium]MBO7349484.1 Hpt domain-containing protein [Spirochaetales bacterium]